MEISRVKDIMTDVVVSVSPETPVVEVALTLLDKHFNGVPVIDADKNLLGLITEFDLITKEKLMQLPALDVAEIGKITKTLAKEVMNKEPIVLKYNDSFEVALATFNQHHRVNPIPVVDEHNKLVGIVSRYDLVKLLRIYGHT